jgi:hypothetical protein
MLMNLVGVRKLDFIGSDGNEVKGTNFFVTFKEEGVTGLACDKLFIRPEISIPKGIEIGKPLIINFNRRGKVESIALAQAE